MPGTGVDYKTRVKEWVATVPGSIGVRRASVRLASASAFAIILFGGLPNGPGCDAGVFAMRSAYADTAGNGNHTGATNDSNGDTGNHGDNDGGGGAGDGGGGAGGGNGGGSGSGGGSGAGRGMDARDGNGASSAEAAQSEDAAVSDAIDAVVGEDTDEASAAATTKAAAAAAAGLPTIQEIFALSDEAVVGVEEEAQLIANGWATN